MEIVCPTCGLLNWLENERRCHACLAVLRRCIDCVNLERKSLHCRALNFEMTAKQASEPTLLSTSANCRSYQPAPDSKVHKVA